MVSKFNSFILFSFDPLANKVPRENHVNSVTFNHNETKTEIATLGHYNPVTSVAFNPNGTLLSGSFDITIKL